MMKRAVAVKVFKPVPGNEKDTMLFSHMNIKAFTPEQLYDSLTTVLGVSPALSKFVTPAGTEPISA